jgi:hypothetical protein
VEVSVAVGTDHLALRDLCKNPALAVTPFDGVAEVKALSRRGVVEVKAGKAIFTTLAPEQTFESVEL